MIRKRYVAGDSSSFHGPHVAESEVTELGTVLMMIHTPPSTLAVTVFTPCRISRVNPYHLAYGVAGAVPCVRRDGPSAAVELEPLESGPDSATASFCGTASRNSPASSFFSSVHPDRALSASEQPANQSNERRVFAYIVGDLLNHAGVER